MQNDRNTGQREGKMTDLSPTTTEKVKVALLFAGLFLITMVPAWCSRYYIAEFEARAAISWGLAGYLLMIICPLAAARWKPQLAGFDTTILPRKWRETGLAIVFALLTLFTCGIVYSLAKTLGFSMLLGHGERALELLPKSYLVLAIVVVSLVGPIAEEIFWRGYALQQFEKIMPGFFALILQAGLWAIIHPYPVGPLICLCVQGVLMGLWRQRMKSLLPLILLHVFINVSVSIRSIWMPYQKILGTSQTERSANEKVLAELEKLQRLPEARQIRKLATKPQDEAVPGIIAYLGSNNENVRTYATNVLMMMTKHESGTAKYYAEALRSPNERVVDGVESVIGLVHCYGLIPQIRETIANSNDKSVQISGVIALKDLGDADGLREIAASHSSEKVRNAAQKMLDRLLKTPNHAGEAKSTPTSGISEGR